MTEWAEMQKALRITACTALLAAAGLAAPLAIAGTAMVNMVVSATIVRACNLTTTMLSLGNDVVNAGRLAATATITVACGKNASSTVSLSLGGNVSKETPGTRAESDGDGDGDGNGDHLGHEIYDGAENATVRNTTSAATVASSSPGVHLIASRKIGSGRALPPGTYSDTVVITAIF